MRDIIEVIDSIIKVIPEAGKQFKISLESIKDTAMYTAPEAEHMLWRDLSVSFNYFVPYPATHEWHELAIAILTDKPVAKFTEDTGE